MAFGNRLIHTESASPLVYGWDISNGFTANGQFNPGSQSSYISRGSEFDSSGNFYSLNEYPSNELLRYAPAGTPYNFSNYNTTATQVLDPLGDYGNDIRFADNGNMLLIVVYSSAATQRYMISYDLTTPYDITTATNSKTLDETNFNIRPLGANFIDDGNKLILRDYSNGGVDYLLRIYSLSVAYDILSTKTLISSIDLPASTVGTASSTGMGILAQNNGSQILLSVQNTSNNIALINFATAFDLNSAKTYQVQTISGLNVGNLAMSVDESYIAFGVEPTANFYCYLIN